MVKYYQRPKCYQQTFRNNWVEFTPRFSNFSLTYEVASYFDSRPMIHICLGWGNLFIHLPFKTKYDECDPPRYGVYYHERSLCFPYGRKIYFLHLPWEYEWVRTSNLRNDGVWEHETKGHKKDFWKDEQWKGVLWEETYPYTYKLENGTIQNRLATVKVVEREWRWRWFKWTKLFSMKRKTIDVSFNEEVGEKSGSYKGGCTGCGYDMLPNENALDTLRRMEKERLF